MRCMKEKETTTYSVKNRSFGSIFDQDRFDIELCLACQNDLGVEEMWFEPQNRTDQWVYKDEEKIEGVIQQLRPTYQTKICSSNALEEQTKRWLKLNEA